MRLTPLLRADGGAVAVEFAFVVPVMLALLFCGYEATRVAAAAMRLNDSAQMMADLVSRQKAFTAPQAVDFCSGVMLVLKPFPTAGYRATVASVTRSASGIAVDWQDQSCGGGAPIAAAAALAAPYLPAVNTSIIIVQASYDYHPLVNSAVAPSLALVRTAYARPRNGTTVSHF